MEFFVTLNGVIYDCVPRVIHDPVPTDPVKPPSAFPTPTGGRSFEGSGMWLYENRQLRTGVLQEGQEKQGAFTIPSSYTGIPEIGISGSNLKAFVDGVDSPDGPITNTPGPHTIVVRAVNGSAEGTVTLYHS
jgi:hypothetical protein